jgi:uncharacterized membrane protein
LIVPHRSLTMRGLRWVVGSLAALSLVVGLRFWFLGAWPVLLFGVAEVGLVLLMLILNMRQARATELVLLTEAEVRVIRTGQKGRRRETVLASAWLSVALEERGGRVPKLVLRRHGISVEIAQALGEAAKRDLAAALTRALHRARNPVFDNPVLRR